MATPHHLSSYYADVDAGDFDAAQARLHPDLSFAIHLPAGARRGTTSEEMVGYLRDRGPVDRVHRLLRTGVDGDLEFVYGAVVEDGVTTTGHFLGSARVVDGLITRYHVSFDVELALLEVGA